MNQTFIRKKTVTICGTIAVSVWLLCVVFSIILVLQQNYAFLIVIFFPTLLGLLFAAIALIEYRSSIEINDQKIKFNYRLFSNTKELSKSGLEFSYREIEAIKKTYRKGDGIISKDCFLYTIYLANKNQVDVYLHHFGKDEDSIFNIINERIQTS